MSYTIFINSLCWSLFIAFFAMISGGFLNKNLASRIKNKNYLFIPLFICFFIPPIAVGYGYTTLSYKLLQFPLLHELLYGLIMVGRLVGPGAILLFYLPSSVSEESKHCMCIASGKCSCARFLKYLFLSNGWRYTFVFVFLFLAAFSEFELASMMNIKHWSVSLFDAHAQGISALTALKVNWVPFLLQFIMIIVLLLSLDPLNRIFDYIRHTMPPESGFSDKKGCCLVFFNFYFSNISSIRFHIASLIFVLCLTISSLFPLVVILKSAVRGGAEAFLNLWMFQEIFHSLLFATFATLAAYLLTLLCNHFSLIKYKIVVLLISLPALIGILPLSLLILQLFQLPQLNMLYNSPLPLLLTLILLALPFMLILRMITDVFMKDESLHSASLLLPFSSRVAAELLWKMQFVKSVWILFFVFTVTYFNFTAATILAPVGMTTITERFYNLMHYGESEKLSATVCVAILIPLLLFIIFAVILKIVIKKWYSLTK